MEIPPKIREYIESSRGSLEPITNPDEPLQLDSLGVVRLVAFLENDLGYVVENEELIPENFATLRTLGELLATKTPTEPTTKTKPSTLEDIPVSSAKREIETDEYSPGEAVPLTSPLYRVVHDCPKGGTYTQTFFTGDTFPPCPDCGTKVRYLIPIPVLKKEISQ